MQGLLFGSSGSNEPAKPRLQHLDHNLQQEMIRLKKENQALQSEKDKRASQDKNRNANQGGNGGNANNQRQGAKYCKQGFTQNTGFQNKRIKR